MLLTLRLYSLFLATLVVFGGGILKTKIGRIEVGSLEPFMLLFAIALFLTSRLSPKTWTAFQKDAQNFLKTIQEEVKAPRRLLLWVSFVFTGVFLAHVGRHYSYDTHLFDMGFTNQAVLYPFSDGKLLQADLSIKRSYLTDHFAPTLLLLSPLTYWWHSSFLVYALQALLLGAGAYLLVRFGPVKKSQKLWLIAGMIILCARTIRNGGFWDFREDALGYFFLCLTLITLHQRRLIAFFVSLSLFVLSKEHLGIVGLGILLPILLDTELPYTRRERAQLAGSVLVFLLGWSVFVFGYITPHMQSGMLDANNITARFANYGNTPAQIIKFIATHPSAWWEILHKQFFTYESVKYIVLIVAPYLFVAWRAWPWILAAGIGVAANVSAASTIQKSFAFQYDLAFMPFLMWSALSGLKRTVDSTMPSQLPKVLFITLFLAFGFSSRWPMFYTFWRDYKLYEIQDIHFIDTVPCPEGTIITGQPRILGLLTRCPEIRILSLPDTCTDPIAELNKGKTDTSRVPGQTAAQANRFVIDHENSCEVTLQKAILGSGGQLLSTSPSGRWSLVTR